MTGSPPSRDSAHPVGASAEPPDYNSAQQGILLPPPSIPTSETVLPIHATNAHEILQAHDIAFLSSSGSDHSVFLAPLSHIDGPSDEDLPDYDPSTTLPTYDRINDDPNTLPVEPVLTYHLRQQSRSLQILVPFGPSPHYCYRIVTRCGFNLFGKKKHGVTLTRILPGRTNSLGSISSASRSTRTKSEGEDDGEEAVWVDFINDSKLPWMPKATLTVKNRLDLSSSSSSGAINRPFQEQRAFHMFAANFKDWHMCIPNSTQTYTWVLHSRPTALNLYAPTWGFTSDPRPIARFSHSQIGSRASRGAEVGALEIFRIDDMSGGVDLETIVGSCMVVLTNFKRMGKHLWRFGA